eukprot:TRINITY_DN93716_c0_g1_i1.p1 TRINITY_DN93716_c0_g1~~TRINITY_DN93716_c0_g1_i1.p1  ORF type:complete len:314 (-),score=96.49 TRINITY_DN93716_c0_g1_i1:97-1038(-)
MAPADDPKVDKEAVEKFLKQSIETLQSKETKELLAKASSGRPGAKIVELQKDLWASLGIEAHAGRAAIARFEQDLPADEASSLAKLKQDFARAADAAYLQCLADRRPKSLEKKAKLKRETILEFLEACNVKLDAPEVRERLQQFVKEKGQMPDDVVNELHDEVMELLGFDRAHGRSCFQELGAKQEFLQDREMAMAYARWRGKQGRVCLEILNEHAKAGADLDIGVEVKEKLLEMQAKDALSAMTLEQRTKLLEKNAKKVNVFRGLPDEARIRYLAKLTDNEKIELAQAEMLMATLVQNHQEEISREAARLTE